MTSLIERGRRSTDLSGSELEHLSRLVREWGMLADLGFSDLLLYGRSVEGGGRLAILDHVRAATAATVYHEDPVGRVVDVSQRPVVARVWSLDSAMEETVETRAGEIVRVRGFPVRYAGRSIAVLVSEKTEGRRVVGELERWYQTIFSSFETMISSGQFPYPPNDDPQMGRFRVGDGILVLDHSLRIVFVSPNARSAFHRLGVNGRLIDSRFDELGLDETGPRAALVGPRPRYVELTAPQSSRSDIHIALRCVPLLQDGRPQNLLVLVRDVTELRQRDRLLESKEVAIREIHHRVKNNLQTISSLLRLQARRLGSGTGRDALEESVRRIKSIALVHETLAKSNEGEVDFDEIVRPLVRTVEDGLVSPDHRVHFLIEGEAGLVPGDRATQLAVVVTELLQNAVHHGHLGDGSVLNVEMRMNRHQSQLHVVVSNDGQGLPPGFTIDSSDGLGLTIVRALVVSELEGSMAMNSEDGWTHFEVEVPLH